MTIPSSPQVARDPKELLVEWGYHLIHRGHDNLKEFDTWYHLLGFERYKIDALYQEKLKDSYESNEQALGRTGSKSSIILEASQKDLLLHLCKFRYPKRICHTTVEPFFDAQSSVLSKGRGAFKIVSLMQQISEVGLFKYWTERESSASKFLTMRQMGNFEFGAPTISPMYLKGKINQVFQIYAMGNGLALLWFTGNHFLVWGINYLKRTPVFLLIH